MKIVITRLMNLKLFAKVKILKGNKKADVANRHSIAKRQTNTKQDKSANKDV